MRRLLLWMCLASCADVTSPEDYVALVDSSRACSADDQCVLAGGSDCTCSAPVHADNQAAVDEAAEQVECNEATIACPAQHDNLRCEAQRCASDQSP